MPVENQIWHQQRQQTTNKQPTTNNQQQTTNNQQPTTNNKQPTTNSDSNNNDNEGRKLERKKKRSKEKKGEAKKLQQWIMSKLVRKSQTANFAVVDPLFCFFLLHPWLALPFFQTCTIHTLDRQRLLHPCCVGVYANCPSSFLGYSLLLPQAIDWRHVGSIRRWTRFVCIRVIDQSTPFFSFDRHEWAVVLVDSVSRCCTLWCQQKNNEVRVSRWNYSVRFSKTCCKYGWQPILGLLS